MYCSLLQTHVRRSTVVSAMSVTWMRRTVPPVSVPASVTWTPLLSRYVCLHTGSSYNATEMINMEGIGSLLLFVIMVLCYKLIHNSL